jgi:hypothetical protein
MRHPNWCSASSYVHVPSRRCTRFGSARRGGDEGQNAFCKSCSINVSSTQMQPECLKCSHLCVCRVTAPCYNAPDVRRSSFSTPLRRGLASFVPPHLHASAHCILCVSAYRGVCAGMAPMRGTPSVARRRRRGVDRVRSTPHAHVDARCRSHRRFRCATLLTVQCVYTSISVDQRASGTGRACASLPRSLLVGPPARCSTACSHPRALHRCCSAHLHLRRRSYPHAQRPPCPHADDR